MSKRRQTIGGCITSSNKKAKKEEEEEEDCSGIAVNSLSDKQLRQCLVKYGECPGPVLSSTRALYEQQLQKHRDGGAIPVPSDTSTPARAKPTSKKASSKALSLDSSPEALSPVAESPIKIESLPDPPKPSPKTKRTPVKPAKNEPALSLPQDPDSLSNKDLRDCLIQLGETPGPINKVNRKLYVDLIKKHISGGVAPSIAARRLSKDENPESPVMSSTRIESKKSTKKADKSRPILSANGSHIAPLQDFPEEEEEEEEMDAQQTMCVSYVKSPYKKTRRSICKAEFDDTDFVVFNSSANPSNLPSHFIDMRNYGIQALVTQDASSMELVNSVKAARGLVKIYAGVTISSVKDARIAVSNAIQCGVDAVVLGFSNFECGDPVAIANCVKQVMQGHLTSSYFYYHKASTKACPVRISKYLLDHSNGYQGIFVSVDTIEKLLQLEILAVKIYETDTTQVLRSLAHGVDSFASFEGIVAMPVIRKLKEEYYEGNTSECCRLQLILCRLVRALTKHGDLIPSLHTALKYMGHTPGQLPTPFQPLNNEVPLLKDLADLNVDKWKHITL